MTEASGWSRDVAPVDYLMHRADTDPRTRTTMMSIEVLEAAPEWGRLREDFERASRVIPRLRQRIVAPLFPLGPAQWMYDPEFDLGYHLRRIGVPEPGTRRQLLDLAQSLYAGPLDPGRPLWEATLVEGVDFDGARAALLFKLSHAVTDGIGGIEMDKQIRSYEPHPRRGPMPGVPVPENLGPIDLTRSQARRFPAGVATALLRNAPRVAGAGARTARHPRATVHEARRMAASLQSVVGPPPVDPSPLLSRRSLGRRFTAVSVGFGELRGAAKARGYSLNDAYIAALCGAMRLYHEAKGLPVDALPLAMPINLRTRTDPAGGNQWAGLRIVAPVGEPDPAQRMEIISELVIAGRDEPAINALKALSPLLARLPMTIVTSLATAAATSDIQATNVPGHTQPTYIGGARVLELLPFGPILGAAMMAVLLSHAGTCYLGVHYDTASFTDADLLDRCLLEGFAEVTAVGVRAPAAT